MRRFAMMSVALGAVAWCSAPAAHANLIVNGTFTSPDVGNGYGMYASIPGWTVNQDSIEVDHTPDVGLPCISDGCQSLEVNANNFDTVSQLVTGLKIGNTYLLSWDYGDRPTGGPQQLDVSFGGTLVTTDFSTGAGTWTLNSFIVTATATSETLSYAAIATSGNPSEGNEIDNVSLVPEPATVALLGVGLLALAGMRRRMG